MPVTESKTNYNNNVEIVQPKSKIYDSVCVILHGYGSLPHEMTFWIMIMDELSVMLPNMKFLLPYAIFQNKIHSDNSGKLDDKSNGNLNNDDFPQSENDRDRYWFEANNKYLTNPEKIYESRDYIKSLICNEIVNNKIDSSRIAIGGFSQGGTVALFTGLAFEYKLGCLFALSPPLPSDTRTFNNTIKNSVNLKTRIFLGYGDKEDKVHIDEIELMIEEVIKFNSIPHV
ncbi:unnamed protein product, partial [Didymodactylos carnosus]